MLLMNKKELSYSFKCILSLLEPTSKYLFINCNHGQSKSLQTYLGGKKKCLSNMGLSNVYTCTVCYFEHHSYKQTKQQPPVEL